MITSRRIISGLTGLYLAGFFMYLFLPLAFMSVVAFNQSDIPQAVPWNGFTLHWFKELFRDDRMWQALINSLAVAVSVVVICVPVGLSAALILTRLHFRAKNLLYALLVSPILIPGIVLGISTFLFWDAWLHIPGGLWSAVMGQSAFISSYCMLLTMARLQRFDRTLEDAAFDLGAGHGRVFFKITLPFLRPALLSAAGLAFMQSFENYNTTLFAIGIQQTLPIYIGTQLRVFISPAMNALGVIFILLTLAGALVYEVVRQKEMIR